MTIYIKYELQISISMLLISCEFYFEEALHHLNLELFLFLIISQKIIELI